MEADTQTAREPAAHRELLQADVLGTISHELRGPLTAIKGYATTLLRYDRHLARQERHQFLQAISDASDRLEVIIERLLEVSELETGQVTLQLAPVDLAYLAGEALIALEARVASHSPGRFTCQLRLEDAGGAIADSVPLVVGDRRRLREVLDNLLDNALQYSPEGGAITVVIRPVIQGRPPAENRPGGARAAAPDPADPAAPRPPEHMLDIRVSDEGQGIAAEHLERIFTRFHRVDTRLAREANGLGLGLTICKYLVALHHGLIWAENQPGGKGSVLCLRLPIRDALLPENERIQREREWRTSHAC